MSTLTQFLGCGGSTSGLPIELLVVGGGGPGGATYGVTHGGGGGGGAGELVYYSNFLVTLGVAYPIVVGAGGSAPSTAGNTGTNGNNSSFGSLSVAGGGRGGSRSLYLSGLWPAVAPLGTTIIGGSGGGGQGGFSTTPPAGSPAAIGGPSLQAGNTSSIAFLIAAANSGGRGVAGAANTGASAGGGGAGGEGGDAAVSTAGTAGPGKTMVITGAETTYAQGGPGVIVNNNIVGPAGTANTGNGGTGGRTNTGGSVNGGSGGSGIIIIAYPDTYAAPASISGTYTTPTRSGYRVYQFTGSGSITF